MAKREIQIKAIGKHIGHAVEGHCRGLLRAYAGDHDLIVARDLPFAFPINTDLVLLNSDGRIRSLVIITYTSDSGDTDKKLDHSSHKFYRTRIEYTEIARAVQERPASFSEDFCPLVVIYGSTSSWKPTLLKEFGELCPPIVYIPSELGESETEYMIADIFSLYRHHWQSGKPKAREHVESFFSDKRNISGTSLVLQRALIERINDPKNQRAFRSTTPTTMGVVSGECVIPAFQTRFRQGLSMAALLTPDERNVFRDVVARGRMDGNSLDVVRKVVLLDLCEVQKVKSIGRSYFRLDPRIPYDEKGTYLPDRPDFADWLNISDEISRKILTRHAELPVLSKSFRAGSWDQASGNLNEIFRITLSELPFLIESIKNKTRRKSFELLMVGALLACDSAHPCRSMPGFHLVWSLIVAAIATSKQDRSVFRRWGFRHTIVDSDMAKRLLSDLERDQSALNLLDELVSYLELLKIGGLQEILDLIKPSLLSLDIPTSWIAAVYLACTTNPSHNPLGHLLRDYIASRPGVTSITGFPNSRGSRISDVFPSAQSRIEWMVVAKIGKTVVCAEVRSITQNNMGNKSKEIFDRNAQTRLAALESGMNVILCGVLDGDFDKAVLDEFVEGIGYDEVIPVRKLIDGF